MTTIVSKYLLCTLEARKIFCYALHISSKIYSYIYKRLFELRNIIYNDFFVE